LIIGLHASFSFITKLNIVVVVAPLGARWNVYGNAANFFVLTNMVNDSVLFRSWRQPVCRKKGYDNEGYG
jgi:hypothetical protein